MSAGFNDLNGLIDNSSFKTGDIRLNINYDISDRLRVEGRFSTFFSDSFFRDPGHFCKSALDLEEI